MSGTDVAGGRYDQAGAGAMPPDVLTPEEAAARLRVSVRTIQKWCRAGAIPTVGVGKLVRIPRHAFDQLLLHGKDWERQVAELGAREAGAPADVAS